MGGLELHLTLLLQQRRDFILSCSAVRILKNFFFFDSRGGVIDSPCPIDALSLIQYSRGYSEDQQRSLQIVSRIGSQRRLFAETRRMLL